MKEIVSYAKSKTENNLTVELQTNGVFDEKYREWLLDNINIMWISFDGEPRHHDKQRHFPDGSPSSPFIENNITWLLENRFSQNQMVGARVTITDDNVDSQISMVDYFASLGIKHIWSDPLFPAVDAIPVCDDAEKLSAFRFNMDSYVDGYVEAKRYAETKSIFYGSFLTCNFDGTCIRHCRACTPAPHFTPDGYVSACDLVTSGKDAGHMDCFVYGSWNYGDQIFTFDNDKIKLLQKRTVDNIAHCVNCKAKEHCGGYCLGEIQNETGSLTGQKRNTCRAINRLVDIIGFAENQYPYMHP
jgi:radical SAM protein with 4Fe4S-binding SPASM domain